MISITITGNVGRDAELRNAGESQVLGIAVAAKSGRDKETIWFDCAVWGRRGEALAPHLTKGSKVTVTGELTLREHNGKVYHKIRVHDIALQGGRRDDGQRSAPTPKQRQQSSGGGFDDDSIPF